MKKHDLRRYIIYNPVLSPFTTRHGFVTRGTRRVPLVEKELLTPSGAPKFTIDL